MKKEEKIREENKKISKLIISLLKNAKIKKEQLK